MSVYPLEKFLARFHVSLRTLFEFSIIVAVFFTADPTVSSLLIGGGVSIVGEALRIWTSGYQRRVSIFYIAGPYRFVRHPRYLGTFLLLLGLCLAGRNFYVLGALLIGIPLVYRYYFRKEELLLLQIAGPEFSIYRFEVPAFIPQIIPVAAKSENQHSTPPQFSFRYSIFRRKRRELDTVFGLILCFVLLHLLTYSTSKTLFNVVLAGILTVFIALRFAYYLKRVPLPTAGNS